MMTGTPATSDNPAVSDHPDLASAPGTGTDHPGRSQPRSDAAAPARSALRRLLDGVRRVRLAIGQLALGMLALCAFSLPWGVNLAVGTVRDLTVVSLTMILTYALWLLSAGRLPRPRWPDLALLALLIWVVLSLRWSIRPIYTIYAIDGYLLAGAAFIAARHLPRTTRERRFLAWSFIAGAVFIAIALFVTWIFHLGPPGRPRAFMINPNYISYSLAAAATIAMAMLRTAGLRSRRVLVATLVLLVAAIVLTGTRGSLLALGLAAAALLVTRRWPPIGLWVPAAVMVGLFAVFLFYLPTDLLRGVDSMSARSTGDLSGRLDLWPVAQDVIAHHRLKGIGAGAFPAANDFKVGAHNLALGVTSELGAVGAVLYVGWVFSQIGEVLGRSRRQAAATFACVFVGWLPIAFSGQWDFATIPFLCFGLAGVVDLSDPPPRSDAPGADAGEPAVASALPVARSGTSGGIELDQHNAGRAESSEVSGHAGT